MITIAHRLETVIESDRIMVLKDGEAIEYAHPHELLADPKGYFSGMVRATGERAARKLKRRAENAFDGIVR